MTNLLLLLLLSRFSRVRLCVTPQTAAHQAPPSLDSPGKNTFGGAGKINLPKKAFPKIVKIVSDLRKGKKPKSKAAKQIRRVLGNIMVVK